MSTAESAATPYVLTLSSRRLPGLLLAIVLTLIAAHIALQFDRFHTHWVPWEIQMLFDLDEEQSVPNWYSSAALGVAAALTAAISSAARTRRDPDAGRWRAMAWVIAYLCFDEVAGLHETFNSLSPISWTVPFGLLAIGIGLWMLPFVWRLAPETRFGIIASGVIYVMGAAGIELVTSQFFDESNKRQFIYSLNTALEEGMEMLAIVLLIRTLLRHMERGAGTAAVELRPERPGSVRA
jgi:hypothetical protein